MSNTTLTAEDRTFLRTILDHPEDLTSWLVYADWLDEQGHALRAEFLRLAVDRRSLPEDNPLAEQMAARLANLMKEVDPSWAMMFDTPRVGNCTWRFRCPRSWDQMTPTDTPDIRFCLDCRKPVFFCHSIEEAEQYASAGECITISSRMFPATDAPFEEEEMYSGLMEFDPEDSVLPIGEGEEIDVSAFHAANDVVGVTPDPPTDLTSDDLTTEGRSPLEMATALPRRPWWKFW